MISRFREVLILILLFPAVFSDYSFPNQYKLCTDEFYLDQCSQIARNQEIACSLVRNKADCVLNADQGQPHVSIVTAEEALLAAPLVSERVVVIGEVVSENPPYQTAVIVRKSFTGGFENLRGLRYCHPGFKHDELVSKYVLEELESKVININCTAENTTIVEKKIKALADFFGVSCRPGKWTVDDALDAKFKNLYPSLCDNCGAEKCNVNYQTPFNDTLSCLVNNGGDVALTSLKDARSFFNSSTNVQNYQYLCSNGSVSDPSVPCTWTNQLNRFIVTSSDSADSIKTYLTQNMASYLYTDFPTQSASSGVIEASLAKIWQLNKGDKINITDVTPLKAYVEGRRKYPLVNESIACDLTVKWSTKNELEQGKCTWLQQAALNAGLQPVIDCFRNTDNDVLSSLDDLKNGYADVAFVDADYGYIAQKKTLTNIAYPETDTRQLSKILIVVRNDTQDLGLTGLKDLQGKSSCFPQFGGKEWLAFVHTIRQEKLLRSIYCDYSKIFVEFVGQSCVPGAKSPDYDVSNEDQEKLCGNCIPVSNTLTAKYCNADDQNKYYGSDGALKCLEDKAGDYAVISKNDVSYAVNTSGFRVLDKNGTISEYTGLDVDENAALTVITTGEVVIKTNSAKLDDVVLLLQSIELEFGQNLLKSFKVFERFNGTRDLLFPDSTPGLSFGEATNKYVENFQKLIRTSELCVRDDNSGSDTIVPSFVMTVLTLVLFNLLY